MMNQHQFDNDSLTHLSSKRSSMPVRVFSNCICNLMCLFPQSHTRACPPVCGHTCQHVSFCTCHSSPFSCANLCCQRARCTSQSAQRAHRTAVAANIKAVVPLHFSGASALQAAANKRRIQNRNADTHVTACTSRGAHFESLCEWRLQKSPSDEMSGWVNNFSFI